MRYKISCRPQIKNSVVQKIISKILMVTLISTNTITYSFANETNIQQNKYAEEINNIETKKDLQKSAQKAIKAGEIDTWITGLANMPTGRYSLTSAVVDGKIYCIGGRESSFPYSNKVEVYDPKTDTWETKANIPTRRERLTSAVVDGKIYCIGGFHNVETNKVEVYDPETDTWEAKANMPTGRYALTSAVVDGKIYCIGGDNFSILNTVEVYDPATDTWETKANIPTSRSGLTSAVVNGKIYCIGGHGKYLSYFNTVEVYDPKTDTWETKTSMPTVRSDLTSAVVNEKIYCIGGYNDSSPYLNTVEVYDPETDTWETKTSMPTARNYLTSGVVNGKIYCIGGYDGSSYLNKVEVYIASTSVTQEKAEEAVSKSEQSKDPTDIEDARDLVNQLPDSSKKDELNARLDALLPKTATSNIDIYIQPQSILSLSLDTNSVTFEDFNGVEDMEMQNAFNLTVESSLPYEVSASLVSEIQNSDKTETADISLLSIKANSDSTYKIFSGVSTPIILIDNQNYLSTTTHGIDLMLNGKILKNTDVYKTAIKFEVNQK